VVRVYCRHAVNLELADYITYAKHVRSGTLVTGDEILSFEKQFAHFIGAPIAISVASARAGFYLTLRAMGVKAGSEVIMPAYTFPSMPAAVVATGARPVFVDVDPVTYNLAPALAAKAVTSNTAAIVVAHLFGRCADGEALSALAAERGVPLIEDCAHAAGAIRNGRRAGSFGDAAVFSFGIGKNMPCFGGGAIVFKDKDLSGKVRKLVNSSPAPEDISVHKKVLGSIPAWAGTRPYVFPWTLSVAARVLDSLGSDAMDRAVREPLDATTKFSLKGLGRMANVQAAVAIEQLMRLPMRNATLARNGQYLAEALKGIPGVQPPEVVAGEEHIYLYFRVLVNEVSRFRLLLRKKGIDTQADDMANCAALEAFNAYATACPVAASLPGRSIELPNNTSLAKGDLDFLAAGVREVAAAVSADAAPSGVES